MLSSGGEKGDASKKNHRWKAKGSLIISSKTDETSETLKKWSVTYWNRLKHVGFLRDKNAIILTCIRLKVKDKLLE